MATTKQQRRYTGTQSIIAAHRRNKKAEVPTAPATEQEVVQLDVSPVNAEVVVPTVPETPAAPVVPETPTAPAAPAAPVVPAEPAALATFSVEQELEFIATGIKTLLGVEGDIPMTREGLLLIGLRTVRQTLMGVLVNEDAVAVIQAKKSELVEKAKALVPPAAPTGKKDGGTSPSPRAYPVSW